MFRLAGDLVVALHGRDLRRAPFLSLWAPADRSRIAAALEAARRSAEPITATAEGRSIDGGAVRLEMLIAPLRADAPPTDRFLGLYQLLTPLAGLRDRPIAELGLIRLSGDSEAAEPPHLRLASIDGRLVGAAGTRLTQLRR